MDDEKRIKADLKYRAVRWSSFTLKKIILILLAIISIYPLFFVIINSVKSKGDYNSSEIGFPKEIVWDAFRKVFLDQRFLRWFSNTVFLTIVSVLICLIIASLAAFALSKMQFKGRRFILNSIISLMVMPVIIMIIPLFVLFGKLQLTNNYIGVILIYVGILMPFNIYLLYSYFINVPQAILESARIDGCGNFQIFLRMMVPLSLSALMALLVVDVLWVWNELLIALIFMQKENMRTLMVGLTLFQGRFTSDVPVIMAGLTAGILPILILYLFTQKYFVKGLVAGSIKE
ncbi:MAG: carbohydrate ABC transporter permease [Actinobacteria bacterium]|nr:carbohydrate ABC transporter permease [Actinomycetota bacterium]